LGKSLVDGGKNPVQGIGFLMVEKPCLVVVGLLVVVGGMLLYLV